MTKHTLVLVDKDWTVFQKQDTESPPDLPRDGERIQINDDLRVEVDCSTGDIELRDCILHLVACRRI